MVKVREEYRKRLKNVLNANHYEALMSRVGYYHDFMDYLNDLTATYLDPETWEATDEALELEDLFALIARDNK